MESRRGELVAWLFMWAGEMVRYRIVSANPPQPGAMRDLQSGVIYEQEFVKWRAGVRPYGGVGITTSFARRPQPTPDSRPQHVKITTFLMFEVDAEEAMNFYISLFDDSEIISIERFGETAPGPESTEGTVYQATFTLAGRPFRAFDSPTPHNFTFTPSISLFMTCETEVEFDRLYISLAEGGQTLMPPGEYVFSRRYLMSRLQHTDGAH